MRRKSTNSLTSFIVADELATIRKKLKVIREQKGLTQGEMCRRLFWSKSVYSKLETGHTAMSLERLLLIVKCLGLSLAEFFEEFESKLENDGRFKE